MKLFDELKPRNVIRAGITYLALSWLIIQIAETLEGILRWWSPDPAFYWNLGTVWLVAGHPDKALQAFEKEVVEGSRELGSIMALHDLGRTDDFETLLPK